MSVRSRAPAPRWYGAAEVVSHILGPGPVITVTAVGMGLSGDVTSHYPMIVCVVLLGLMQFVAGSQRFVDARDNRGRMRGYLLIAVSYGSCTVAMHLCDPHSPLMFMSSCMLVGAMVMGIVNTATKVSVHCGSVSICASLLSVVVWPFGLLSLPLVPLVGWSRVHMGRHTAGQVLMGTVVGLAVPLVMATIMCI